MSGIGRYFCRNLRQFAFPNSWLKLYQKNVQYCEKNNEKFRIVRWSNFYHFFIIFWKNEILFLSRSRLSMHDRSIIDSIHRTSISLVDNSVSYIFRQFLCRIRRTDFDKRPRDRNNERERERKKESRLQPEMLVPTSQSHPFAPPRDAPTYFQLSSSIPSYHSTIPVTTRSVPGTTTPSHGVSVFPNIHRAFDSKKSFSSLGTAECNNFLYSDKINRN